MKPLDSLSDDEVELRRQLNREIGHYRMALEWMLKEAIALNPKGENHYNKVCACILPNQPNENPSPQSQEIKRQTAQHGPPSSVLEEQPTPPAVYRNAVMSITERVNREMERYKAQTGKEPQMLILGENQWEEMQKAAEPFLRMDSPPLIESARAEYKGMKIYQIDAKDFIVCGYRYT